MTEEKRQLSVKEREELRRIIDGLAAKGMFLMTAKHKLVLDAAEAWFDSFGESGLAELEPEATPQEVALYEAVKEMKKP